jgi:hypothetical protein
MTTRTAVTAHFVQADSIIPQPGNAGDWNFYNLNGKAQDLPLPYPSLLHFRKPALSQFFLMLDTKNPVSHRVAMGNQH